MPKNEVKYFNFVKIIKFQTMKKIILSAAILLVTVSLISCGASRKYGCPSVAKQSTNSTLTS